MRGRDRWLSVAILLVAAVAMAVGGNAYTAVGLERGTGFNVVNDSSDGVVWVDNASSVETGKTNQTLVTVNNTLSASQDVTVELSDATAWSLTSSGTLSRTVTLASSEVESFSVDVNSGASTGEAIYWVNSTDGSFWFSQRRTVQIKDSGGGGGSVSPYVFTYNNNSAASIFGVRDNATQTDSGVSGPPAIGTPIDCDGDDNTEVPYSPSGSNTLYLVDLSTGSTTSLVSDAYDYYQYLPHADVDGDGNQSILYVDTSSKPGDPYAPTRYECHSGESKQLASVSLDQVYGYVDFNGDGDRDIVYTKYGGNAYYYDGGSGVDTGVAPDSEYACGHPKDFDDDGEYRLPCVVNGAIGLINASGGINYLNVTPSPMIAGVAPTDWDDDDELEVMYADGNSELYYAQLDETASAVKDDAGHRLAIYNDAGPRSQVNVTPSTIETTTESDVEVGENNRTLVSVSNTGSSKRKVTVDLENGVRWVHNSTGTDTNTVTLSPSETETFYVDVDPDATTGGVTFWVNTSDGNYSEQKSTSLEYGISTTGVTEVANGSVGQKLVNVTNTGDDTEDVTVDLEDGVAWTLNATGTDTRTVTLSPGSSATYSVDVDSTASGTASYWVNASDGSYAKQKSVDIVESTYEPYVLSYNNNTAANIFSVRSNATQTDTTGPATYAIGAPLDCDSDDNKEVPYSPQRSNALKLVDVETGTTTTVVSGDVWDNHQYLPHYDVDGDGNLSIVYVDDDDGGASANAYPKRYECHSGETAKIASINVDQFYGYVDFDGDGSREPVYTKYGTADLYYYTAGYLVSVGVTVDSRHACGTPKDFDGDGEIRIPCRYNSEVALINNTGDVRYLNVSATPMKASMATYDWNDDGQLDIVYADTNSRIHWLEQDGTNHYLKDANGNVLLIYNNAGVRGNETG